MIRTSRASLGEAVLYFVVLFQLNIGCVMSKHRAGGKFTGSHTTVIDKAIDLVDAANKLPCVSKIVLGLIEAVRSKKPRLKFNETSTGWEVLVYSQITLQTIYVYTSDRKAVRATIRRAFVV